MKMRISSNFLKSSLVLAASIALFSCNKKDDNNNTGTTPVVTSDIVIVSSNISANTTWSSDKIYQLAGRITVLDGATLTIEPGTIIKGEAGTGANATALLIARGGKLMAEGSETKPIIFTSVADEISIADVAAGSFKSPNLNNTINGLWGGVLICGKAKISASANEVQIEGIPTSDQNGLYGGSNDADNSGTLKYISIRHGGANIGSGNEINGLTLAGVGSATVIENIEIVANQDDGIEFFGGKVSVKNVLVMNNGDDAIDTDQSWSGTLDNFVIITPGDHCFELDGPEGSYSAGHTIKNGTIVAHNSDRTSGDLINTDKNSIVNLENLFFASVKDGQVVNRTTDNPDVNFTNIVINIPSGSIDDYIKDGSAPAGITAGSTSSNKANASVFNGWTFAALDGATSGL